MAKPIWDLIRKRFPESEYALLQEVRDAAGFQASRSADGIAMNLWPSRGLEINGIEIKSYRGDWLNEMKKPVKAEAIFKYCDRFWLVAADDKVVLNPQEEIPKTWGLLVAKNDKLCMVIEAPKLNPEPLTKHFVAAMLKRATKDLIHPSTIEDKIEERVKERIGTIQNDLEFQRKQYEELKGMVQKFESASGVTISRTWGHGPEKIGKTVNFILDGGIDTYKSQLEDLRKKADFIGTSISHILQNVPLEAIKGG